MAIKRNAQIELFWRLHLKLYRWSGGRIGRTMLGLPILLLTTTGRKSGLTRTNALMYITSGQNFVVFASNLGEPRHPAWWHNLRADPNTYIEIGRSRIPVRAREAEGEEREALWRAATEKVAEYDSYQGRTSRRIPVVVLERLETP